MNHNENYFHQKFAECSKYLSVKANNLISLKYREVRDHRYYLELLDHIRKIKGLNVEDIGNALNGRSYLVSTSDQKIVLVEHETGLEILYIAGSIASLIGLVLQISSMIGNHRRNINSFPMYFEDVEVRYFDESGKFIEEHKHNHLPYEMFLPPSSSHADIDQLNKKIAKLEKKIEKLSSKRTKKKKK